jgi:hypothetical protein
MKFKLRKDMRIGALAAESDDLLHSAFVDLGVLDTLLDTNDPRFLVLGRAGSGKTALLSRLRNKREHVSVLDPDDLSMQYLHNSTILKTISSWGVNLDIFYKYLWRHVCILELIRMRYGEAGDVPSVIQQVFDFAQIWRKDERKARELSQEYLQRYGNDYWIRTDTRIKSITTEIESKLSSDPKVGASLSSPSVRLNGSFGLNVERKQADRVEQEIVERAQKIVSDFQIAALNRVVELLETYGFVNEQNCFYILIDDLDKNWMPDDELYLDLLKTLIFSVADLNRKLSSVKIIVALRENIYHRVFQNASQHEPQREKWRDLQVRLQWTKKDLEELVNRRLREVLRGEYTLKPPTLTEILPEKKRRGHESALAYLLDRTFLRPRDVIDFVNTAIEQSDSFTRLSWSHLMRAESEFSQRRLQSVFDEWRDGYFGLPALFPLLRRLGHRFQLGDITEHDVYEILEDPRVEKCVWLGRLQSILLQESSSIESVKHELVAALYLVGIVGIKRQEDPHVLYSFDRAFNYFPRNLDRAACIIHKMFWHALNIGEKLKSLGAAAGES